MNEGAWECQCGYVNYASAQPEECPDCMSINSFVQLPEEIIREREINEPQKENPLVGNSNLSKILTLNVSKDLTKKKTVKKTTKKKKK